LFVPSAAVKALAVVKVMVAVPATPVLGTAVLIVICPFLTFPTAGTLTCAATVSIDVSIIRPLLVAAVA